MSTQIIIILSVPRLWFSVSPYALVKYVQNLAMAIRTLSAISHFIVKLNCSVHRWRFLNSYEPNKKNDRCGTSDHIFGFGF